MTPHDDMPAVHAAAVDLEAVRDLRAALDDDALLADIIETFLVDTPARLTTLAHAVGGSDWDAAAREAHAVRGAAATLGLADLAGSCARIETLTEDQAATALASVESARRAHAAAGEALRRYLADLR